jgi:Ca2+/Na+ antiporter
MRLATFSALYLLLALYFVMTVAAEVYINEVFGVHTLFLSLLAATIVTSIAALPIDTDIPM